MNEFPTTAAARVQSVTNNTPCWIPDADQFVDPNPPATEVEDPWNAYANGYNYGWNQQAFYAAFAEIRAELTSS